MKCVTRIKNYELEVGCMITGANQINKSCSHSLFSHPSHLFRLCFFSLTVL